MARPLRKEADLWHDPDWQPAREEFQPAWVLPQAAQEIHREPWILPERLALWATATLSVAITIAAVMGVMPRWGIVVGFAGLILTGLARVAAWALDNAAPF